MNTNTDFSDWQERFSDQGKPLNLENSFTSSYSQDRARIIQTFTS